MAFRVGFDDVVIDTSGNALSNVEVSVYKTGTSELQTIYNERSGGSTKTNPFTTTSTGRITFYIESPQFDVTVKDLNVPERFTARTITIDRVPGGGTSAQVLVSNASGLFVPATMSGDATISSTGALTIGNEKVEAKHLKSAAVEEAKIKDAAVSTTKIKDAAVTSSKLERPVVGGAVSSAGAVTGGSGFTAAKTGTGVYTITLATELSANGVIVPSPITASSGATNDGLSKKVFTVRTIDDNGGEKDSGFTFFIQMIA